VHRLNNASGFHIGAFERRGELAVPVMQYVTNIYHLDMDTGVYSDLRSTEARRISRRIPTRGRPGRGIREPASSSFARIRTWTRFPPLVPERGLGILGTAMGRHAGRSQLVARRSPTLWTEGTRGPEALERARKDNRPSDQAVDCTRRSSARIATCRATVSGSPIPSSARPAITEPIESGPEANKLPRWTSASAVTSPQTSSRRRERNFERARSCRYQ